MYSLAIPLPPSNGPAGVQYRPYKTLANFKRAVKFYSQIYGQPKILSEYQVYFK